MQWSLLVEAFGECELSINSDAELQLESRRKQSSTVPTRTIYVHLYEFRVEQAPFEAFM